MTEKQILKVAKIQLTHKNLEKACKIIDLKFLIYVFNLYSNDIKSAKYCKILCEKCGFTQDKSIHNFSL